MKYIKDTQEYLLEEIEIKSRRMYELISYFNKSIDEKRDESPVFFDDNYPHILEEWCYNNVEYFLELDEYEDEDEAMAYVQIPTKAHELEGYPVAFKEYKTFLCDIIDDFENNNNNPYELWLMPLYITYTYEGEVDNDWMVHFTPDEEIQEKIIDDGYFLGIGNLYHLAVSAGDEDGSIKNGYSFAFDMDDIYYNYKNDYGHYGERGILFKSSGIKLYHKGDDEVQTIFIGNDVSDLIPFYCNQDTKIFQDVPETFQTDDIDYFFETIIAKHENK